MLMLGTWVTTKTRKLDCEFSSLFIQIDLFEKIRYCGHFAKHYIIVSKLNTQNKQIIATPIDYNL